MGQVKILAMLRIKNEEEWIGKVLEAASPLVDGFVILDDGSTDGTPNICKQFPKVLHYETQYKPDLDEVRDKERLLQLTLAQEPDWVIALDGDEVLEEGAAELIRQVISTIDRNNPQYTAFSMQFLYFWNDKETYRIEDSIYGNFWQKRLFTTWGQEVNELTFRPTGHGGNFHCGSVPSNLAGKSRAIDVKVKHYGYLWKEQREKKKKWYEELDPAAAHKGYYDHLTEEEGMELAWWETRRNVSPLKYPKANNYYQQFTCELLEVIPADSRVLDLGCGYGRLARELKKRNDGVELVGIDHNSQALRVAKGYCQNSLSHDLEKDPWHTAINGKFDVVVLDKVLEELMEPETVLIKAAKILKEDGYLLISTHSGRNFMELVNYCKGKRRQTKAYTLIEIHELLESVGFNMEVIKYIKDPRLNLNQDEALKLVTVEAPGITLKDLNKEDLDEMTAKTIVIRAYRKEKQEVLAVSKPLTSIIMLTCNQLAYTVQALNSLKKNTTYPYELIIVDNGSTDGTVEYVENLNWPNLRLIKNEVNRGFAEGNNQGLAVSQGKYIVLVNNDVIFTPDWLKRLITAAEKSPQIGLVGPVTNYASGRQKIEVNYTSIEKVDGFADELWELKEGNMLEVDRLIGFCLLIKSEVVKKIGGLDTTFGLGNFEDDDYCLRAKIAGYRLIIAEDIFLHHFGHATFKGEKLDYAKIMGENGEKFVQKWGLKKIRGGGYSLEEVKKMPFQPKLHYIPLTPIHGLKSEGLTLDIGCGYNKQGDIGLDVSANSSADVICNLGFEEIPFPDSYFDKVYSRDCLEHINKVVDYREHGKWKKHFPLIEAINEVYRVLKPGGVFECHVPCYPDRGVFQDPTHVAEWTDFSWYYFLDDTVPHLKETYGIKTKFKALKHQVEKGTLSVLLEAVKT